MATVVIIGLFGAAGCISRYALSTLAYRVAGPGFPAGTLVVNATGAFLIGLIMEFSIRSAVVPPLLRSGLTIGFLGGLTTFSTFSYETFRLLDEGNFAAAAGNVAGNVAVCLLLTWAGIAAARHM